MGEILDAEVFDLVNGETIRSSGARVAAIPNGLGDDFRGERRGRSVQRATLVEMPLHLTCLGVGGVADY